MLRLPIGGKEINGHFILPLLVSPLRPARKLGERISNLFRRSSRVVISRSNLLCNFFSWILS
ncbi:hypothetical protein PVAP13_9NG142473 [Panicum virgatum]|uniref:Uncharacterized protein n=1 Tax=Panicum virgatum TaxID=38727 RepID=A0A8T0MFX3_PANVG|nr:hypothetical protein PVAP13_9NG142473 [Panicum virgatum]KAG2535875.1 hypothetical protein PVAP13_9NG142473 [Panicum virgatum]